MAMAFDGVFLNIPLIPARWSWVPTHGLESPTLTYNHYDPCSFKSDPQIDRYHMDFI